MTRMVMILVGMATVGTSAWALAGRAGERPDEAATTTHDSSSTSTALAGTLAAPGRVEATSEEIEIGAELVGRLARVDVDEGDRVAAGDVLAQIEDGDYRARVSSAEARLAAAQADRDRLVNGARSEERREAEAQRRQAEITWTQAEQEHRRRASLHRQGAIALEEAERASRDADHARARLDETTERARVVAADARPDELSRASASVTLAEAMLEEARALLEKTRIRSPLAGTVIRRHRLVGELVSPETGPVMVVADLSRLRVRVDVDETDVARLAVGQPVRLRADAYGDRRFTGRISRIGLVLGRKNIRTDRPTERTDTSVLETLVDLDPGAELPLGLRVDVFIEPGVVDLGRPTP